MSLVRSFRDLDVYQNAMQVALRIFEVTKEFPPEEPYSLTDQIRRSSRSVCANIAEAWRKRRYKPAFISKLSDAETEAAETQVWLEFAARHRYIDEKRFTKFDDGCDKVISQLVRMSQEADRWILHTATPKTQSGSYARTPKRKCFDTP